MDLSERNIKLNSEEKDGEYISVEYTREDGQRVIGDFKRIGWTQAPKEVIAEVNDALSRGPIAMAGGISGGSDCKSINCRPVNYPIKDCFNSAIKPLIFLYAR